MAATFNHKAKLTGYGCPLDRGEIAVLGTRIPPGVHLPLSGSSATYTFRMLDVTGQDQCDGVCKPWRMTSRRVLWHKPAVAQAGWHDFQSRTVQPSDMYSIQPPRHSPHPPSATQGALGRSCNFCRLLQAPTSTERVRATRMPSGDEAKNGASDAEGV